MNMYWRLKRKIVRFWQRGRRGWADEDVWSFDDYITRVMAEGIAHLADTDHGWPGENSKWPTHEEWVAYLRDLSGRLRRWDADSDDVTAPAVHEVADILGHLWD